MKKLPGPKLPVYTGVASSPRLSEAIIKLCVSVLQYMADGVKLPAISILLNKSPLYLKNRLSAYCSELGAVSFGHAIAKLMREGKIK